MNILLVTVNFHNEADTIRLLESMMILEGKNSISIYIADNESTTRSAETLNRFILEHPELPLKLVPLAQNFGYFGAVNRVFERENLDPAGFDAVIVCNNDTLISDQYFLKKLEQKTHDTDVIAPHIVSLKTNKFQNPHRETITTPRQKMMYRMLFISYPLGKLLYLGRKGFLKIKGKKPHDYQERDIFSAHGSFMIFTRSYFNKGGVIDDGFFMYHEEDSVACQCYHFHGKIRYVPSLLVVHNEHQVTGSFGFRKPIYDLQKKAYHYIRKKYKLIY